MIKEQIEEIIEQQLKEDSTQSATYDKILDLVDEFEEIYKQYIDHLEEERDFERRDKIQIVKQFDDPNDYVNREDYIKLEQQLAEKDKEIEELKAYKKGAYEKYVSKCAYLQQQIKDTRKQVCEQFRKTIIERSGFDTEEQARYWTADVDIITILEIIDELEKGEQGEQQ